MSIITEYHRCGFCGKKQAGVEVNVYEGGTSYHIRCRGCKCSAWYGWNFGGRLLPAWPGGEAAAAALIDSDEARGGRRGRAQRERDEATDRAWENLLKEARAVVRLCLGDPQVLWSESAAAIRRMGRAIRRLELLEALELPDGRLANEAPWNETLKAILEA